MTNSNRRERLIIDGGEFEVVVTDDGSRTLYSKLDNETFHSESGALAESKLVFAENSLARQRLRNQFDTRILEIGYGTGLNFLLTAEAAIDNKARLEYVAIDNRRVNADILRSLNYESLLNSETSELFQAWLKWHAESDQIKQEKGDAFCFGSNIELRVHWEDATRFRFVDSQKKFDAVYLDAFSPGTSPELWTAEFFAELNSCLLEGGRLVTYCVKSEIQRRLRAAGFHIQKTRGPVDGKREVLIAIKPENTYSA